MKTPKHLATAMAVAMVATSVAPVMAATTTSSEEIIGKNRTETAVKISQDGWKSAETVILVNDSAIPDALTATPLAYAKNAPILLTGKDGLSKETADEIKRLGAKDVIMIGGDAVLTSKVEEDLKALNVKTDRIKGASREETALAIAKRLDGVKDVSEIAVVNGMTGLADAVSVAAAAAEKGMPILLANPKSGLSVVEKFIKDEAIKSSFIIGGDKAVSNEIAKNLPGKQRIEGANRNDTNAKVIETFYADKELDNLYLAKDGMENSGQLIDALAVGALAAKNGAPVLIASKKLSANQTNVVNTKKISTITQVGGNGNEKAFDELKEIEKSETIKVKNEAELQEALKKANANDVIEIESSASISKDVTLSTNNAVEINVKGDLKGEVTVKAPNADIKNSGSIGTLVVKDGKNTTIENTSGGKIDKVEVDSSSENVKVENNGKIDKVENNANGTTIENNGTISKPVTGTTTPNVEGNKPGGGDTSGGGSSSGTVTPSVKYYDVATSSELADAIANVKKGEVIRLMDNITVDKQIALSPSGETIIDLNGFTLTSEFEVNDESGASIENVEAGEILTIKNGNLKTKAKTVTNSCIDGYAGGTINLDNIVYTTSGSGVFLAGKNATANIINTTINSQGYCVTTNAKTKDNHGVIYNLKGSTFNGGSGEHDAGTAILVNVPGTYTIDNCTIQGYLQGVVVRGGTATISNTTITNTLSSSDLLNYFEIRNWGSGNMVNLAVLTVGNKTPGSYQYPTNVKLTNTKLINGNRTHMSPAIYMWGNDGEGLGATVTYDNACTIDGDIILGNNKCTINGVTGPLPKPVEPEKPTQPEKPETTTK